MKEREPCGCQTRSWIDWDYKWFYTDLSLDMPAKQIERRLCARHAAISFPAFKVGDRVARYRDVCILEKGVLHGVIVERYAVCNSRFGDYPELYAVKWDDRERVEYGFFAQGLRLEEK